MADLRQCSREFLAEFIAMYESFPCIWRIKSKDYSDRAKKRQAYEVLVKKFKEIDGTANRETVVKKINSLRSVYRRELAKVNKSHRSGAGECEIYKPSLWYFDLLNFLKDQETPRQSRNTIDDDEDFTKASGQEVEEDVNDSYADSGPDETPATPASDASTPSSASRSAFRHNSRSQSSARKRKGVPKDDTTEIMALVGKKLVSLQAEDAFQVFGKHVANKLRNVDAQQNMFAQKLISDILFEAEMNSLTRHFRIVDTNGQRQDDLLSGQNRC